MILSPLRARRVVTPGLLTRRWLHLAPILTASAVMHSACVPQPSDTTGHHPPPQRYDTGRSAPHDDASLAAVLAADPPAHDEPAVGDLTSAPPRSVQRELPPGPTRFGHGVSVWSPRPGERLSAQRHSLITVRGELDDRWRAAQVLVNGRQAALSDEGHFQATLTPRVGTQHIVIEVTDEAHEEPVEVAMDVFWAAQWSPLAEAQPLHAHLGPDFWMRPEDEEDDALTLSSPSTAADLSRLLEFSLRDVLVHEAWRAHRREASPVPWELRHGELGEVDVFLEPHAGALSVMVSLTDVALTISGRGDSGDLRAPRPFEAHVGADMAVMARLQLTPDAHGALELRPRPPVEVELYRLQWSAEPPTRLSRVDTEALDDDLRDLLRGELAPALLSEAVVILRGLTEVLDLGASTWAWPASRSTPLPSSSWRAVSLDEGVLSATLDVSVEQGVGEPLEIPRAVYGAAPSFWSGGRGVQVVLPVDALNDVVAGLWHHGDIDDVLWRAAADDPARSSNSAAPTTWLRATSMPLIVESPPGSLSPLRLELGQLLVRPGSQGPALGATLTADATLTWRAGRLVLSVSPQPAVRLWPWRPTPRAQWRRQAARVRPWLTEALGREWSEFWARRPLWGPGDPVMETPVVRRRAQWSPDGSAQVTEGWITVSSQVRWPALE